MTCHRFALVLALSALAGCSSEPPVDDTPDELPGAPAGPSLPPLTLASTLGCGLPSLPDLRNTCPRIEPRYASDVEAAVEFVVAGRPDLVSFPDRRVLDHRGYTNAVVDRLRQMGYCAVDQLEEIAVKRTNDFNEQYNIWTSLGYVRKSYITTCFPAQF